jgi:formylglycine-generating enzyme required for sulfatase activity
MTGSNRVIRGGNWNNNAHNCRSANRNNNWPGNRNNNIGFRLASSPRRPTARVHGLAPSAPVVTRAAIPRPATGTNSTAAPAGPYGGRGRRLAWHTAVVLAAAVTALAPRAARANTAYSNQFTIDLRSCTAPEAPTLTAPGSQVSGVQYIVAWTATSPSGTYELQEATAPGFAGAQTFPVTEASRSFTHAPGQTTTYYYRVRAQRVCAGTTAWSAWSEAASTVVAVGAAPVVTRVEPSRLFAGSGCAVRIRVLGRNLAKGDIERVYLGDSSAKLDSKLLANEGLVNGEETLVGYVTIPSGWQPGAYGLEIVGKHGSTHGIVQIVPRDAPGAGPKSPGGPYVWVLGIDVVKPGRDQALEARRIVDALKLHPAGVRDILMHVTATLSLQAFETFFETLIAAAGDGGIRVHAWCSDYQGEGSAEPLVPAGVSRIRREVDGVLAWNVAHPERERFAGVHLNIEAVERQAGCQPCAAATTLQVALADLLIDLRQRVGPLVLSLSPEGIHADETGKALWPCNVSQFVDVLIPQLYITGRCDPSVAGDGTPHFAKPSGVKHDVCVSFENLGAWGRELGSAVRPECAVVLGTNVSDTAVLQRPDGTPKKACPPVGGVWSRSVFEFPRSANVDPKDDDPEYARIYKAGFRLSAMPQPNPTCDFTRGAGMFSWWFPFTGEFNVLPDFFPGPETPQAGDWIEILERTRIPTEQQAKDWGFDSASYWFYEALVADLQYGVVTVGQTPTQVAVNNVAQGGRFISMRASESGGQGVRALAACAVTARIEDPLGGLFTEVPLPLGQAVQVPIPDAMTGAWGIRFTSTCSGVEVDYAMGEATVGPAVAPPSPRRAIPRRPEQGSCEFSLTPTSRDHGSGGGSGSISVTTLAGCSWSATPGAGWLHITGGASGTGSGTVSYSVDANTTINPRSATITAGGQPFTVNQAGLSCTYSLTPTSRDHGSGSGSGSISVTTLAGCSWSATTGDGWLHITGDASGTGGGTVSYSVDANTTTHARSGTITVGGQPFTVNQAPAGPDEITVLVGPNGTVPLVMVRIPAGNFTMGSPDGERGRYSNEGPQHQVTITQPFYLGRTEVTQAQWQAVMGTAMPTDCGSYGTGADYPVYCVSWNDICGGTTGSSCTPASFIGKLNAQQSTTTFRLPTEAEWEYAARGGDPAQGGTTGPFSFDTSANPNWDTGCGSFPQAEGYMWWCGNSGWASHPVGQKLANPLGLFDMHGNLWEWVSDWYGSYASSAQSDPQGPGAGSLRVVRGGHWYNYAHNCRSAYRYYFWPGDRFHNIGFRLARSQ